MEFPKNWDEAGTKTVSRRSQRYNLTRLRWNMSHEAKLYFIVHCALDGLHEISGCRFRYRRSWKKEINCYGEMSIPNMWIFLPRHLHIFSSNCIFLLEVIWEKLAIFCLEARKLHVRFYNKRYNRRKILPRCGRFCSKRRNSCWTKFELSKIFFSKKETFPKKEKKTKIKYTLEIRSSISSEKKLSNFSKLIELQSSRVKGLN